MVKAHSPSVGVGSRGLVPRLYDEGQGRRRSRGEYRMHTLDQTRGIRTFRNRSSHWNPDPFIRHADSLSHWAVVHKCMHIELWSSRTNSALSHNCMKEKVVRAITGHCWSAVTSSVQPRVRNGLEWSNGLTASQLPWPAVGRSADLAVCLHSHTHCPYSTRYVRTVCAAFVWGLYALVHTLTLDKAICVVRSWRCTLLNG